MTKRNSRSSTVDLSSPNVTPSTDRWLRWRPVLLIFVVTLVPLWRAIFAGETPGAFDQVAGMGWVSHAPKPATAWDVLQADSVLQFYVWRDLVFDSWRHGLIPAWNHFELFGMPLLANSQSGAFYPPHILVALLQLPTGMAITLLAWLHLTLAGVGVYVLCRRLGAQEVGATIAGAAFATSAFMVAWTALASVISTVAWIPWALAFCVRGHRAGLAGAVAMMLLAGHLQFAAYGLMAIVTVGLWFAIAEKSIVRVGSFAGALALGCMLAAPQVLPVLSYSQFSHRKNAPSEEGYASYVAGAIQPFELSGLAFPDLLGNPQERLPAENADFLSAYWPQYFKRGGNFAESAIGFGAVVVLGLCLLRRKSTPWKTLAPVIAVGGVALLLAIGTPLNRLLYFGAPGWSATGSPGRIGFLALMCACVVASFGFDRDAMTPEQVQDRKGFLPLIGYAAIIAASLLLVQSMSPQTWLPGQHDGFGATLYALGTSLSKPAVALRAVVILVVGAVFLLKGSKHVPAFGALLVAVLLQNGQTVRTSSAFETTRETKSFERVANVPGNWDLLRASPAFMPPNLSALRREHEAGGYDSLVHRDTAALLKEIDGQDASPPANGNMMFVKPGADEAKLVTAGISEIRSRLPIEGAQPDADGVFKKALAGHRATVGDRAAMITAEDAQSLRLMAEGPGRLVLHDRNMPGWSVVVDGYPAELKGERWREVDLSTGKHIVEFKYTPPGMRTGFVLFGLAAILLGVSTFFAHNMAKKS